MTYDRIIYVSIGKTNQNKLDLIDAVRRQFDHLGPIGIMSKLYQTNQRFLEKGYLRFVLPTRAMRRKVIERIKLYCNEAVIIRQMKRPRRR